MAAHPKPTPESLESKARPNPGADSCTTPIDRNAPAGSPGSLGAKSDCNGRPATDDGVVEAMDEQGPLPTPPNEGSEQGRQ